MKIVSQPTSVEQAKRPPRSDRSTPEKRAAYNAYAREWYAKNSAKVLASQKVALQEKMAAMSPGELQAFKKTLKARSKASVKKKPEYYRKQWRDQWAGISLEERKTRVRKWYLSKRERLSQDEAALAAFKAAARARHDAWRDANRDHVNEQSRLWAQANQEYRRCISVAMMHRRRVAGPLDSKFVQWLRTQPCVDCGATERIEVGHVIPVKLGGSNDPSNLIPQCRPCNRRLSSKPHRRALDSG